jgi:hypothetical protein
MPSAKYGTLLLPIRFTTCFFQSGRDPEAKVYAPPGLRKKRQDIVFDADLRCAPSTDWVEEIDQVVMHGNLITTEVVFFHIKSRTVLFADLIQQLPTNLISGWRSIVAKLDLMVVGAA